MNTGIMSEQPEVRVGRLLTAEHLTIAAAESCTGGLLTSRLTDVAGSSAYVKGSVVSYTNEVKDALLGRRGTAENAGGGIGAGGPSDGGGGSAAYENGYWRRHYRAGRAGRR